MPQKKRYHDKNCFASIKIQTRGLPNRAFFLVNAFLTWDVFATLQQTAWSMLILGLVGVGGIL